MDRVAELAKNTLELLFASTVMPSEISPALISISLLKTDNSPSVKMIRELFNKSLEKEILSVPLLPIAQSLSNDESVFADSIASLKVQPILSSVFESTMISAA